MKKSTIILSLMIATQLFASCEHAEEMFTLVNCSDKTITVYEGNSKNITNKELFDRFKREDLTDTVPILLFSVAPKRSYRKSALGSFEYQFSRTDDNLIHMYIIDVDSVKAMCKQTAPDSSIVNRLVMKRMDYSKRELEAVYKTIVYCED